MSLLKTDIPTDTWVTATWEEYMEAIANPACEKARCYYYNGQVRIEMSPVGSAHADDNEIISFLVNLFGLAKSIPLKGKVNCSYRKAGKQECQPDLSYYIGDRAKLSPKGISVVDLNTNPTPDLVIEIASTTLADDLGTKRMLYEELGVTEYWVVDVKKAQIVAFKITATGGSQRINESGVLPGLEIALMEEALQRSRDADNTEVGNWFLERVKPQ